MAAERDWERRIGRRLKLRDLHILSKVVEWGSMVKAASHLGMSQPAVSEAIANLEAALRVRLLDRNARGIEPTIYAATLLKRERVVFDELQQGIKEIEFLLNPEAGEVRLGTSENSGSGFSTQSHRPPFAAVSQNLRPRIARRHCDCRISGIARP